MSEPGTRNVPAAIAVGVICLALGAAGGYLGRAAMEGGGTNITAPVARPGAAAPPPMMGGPGGGMGGPGGGAGGPMAGGASSGRSLAAVVRGVGALQMAQGKGLTPEQAEALLPLLKQVKAAESLPEEEAATRLAAVNDLLSEDQKAVIQASAPFGRRTGGGPGGAPGGGGGMGQQPDPDKPFASERNRKALDDLIASLGG